MGLLWIPRTIAHENISLRISPASQYISTQPGSSASSTMSLTNTTNKPQQVTVSVKDFEPDKENPSRPHLMDTANPKYGIANWFADANLSKSLTIPANQTIEYKAVFNVPASASEKTYFGAIVFSGTDEHNAPQDTDSLIFLTVGAPKTTFTITDMELRESGDATKPYGVLAATINNQSDGIIQPVFTLKITDSKGKNIVSTQQEERGDVLPSSSREFLFSIPNELSAEALTATLSAVDQNGVATDKSIQIDLSPDSNEKVGAGDNTKDGFPWLLLGLALSAFMLLGLGFLLLKYHRDSTSATSDNNDTATVAPPDESGK